MYMCVGEGGVGMGVTVCGGGVEVDVTVCVCVSGCHSVRGGGVTAQNMYKRMDS